MAKASFDYTVVIRGNEGLSKTIPSTDLLVGDIIKIETGMKIPADCIII